MWHYLFMALSPFNLVFDKDVSGKKTEIRWIVEPKNKLIEILGKTLGESTEIICDQSFKFLSYSSLDSSDDQSFTVTRDNHLLKATKKSQSGSKEKTFDIGSKSWSQDFSFGLKSFFLSSDNEYKFEIINPKDLVIRTMVATKGEIEYKLFNGIEFRARKVKVTLDGYYKKFWKAELWYDTKTCNLLYYKANEGPSTPYTILTLKELKN